jgi:beta-ribofuranosylaminobenzene 5'-phosphate synthase
MKKPKKIEIAAPSRLHITLVDMHGTFSGRVDGGIGIALQDPQLRLTLQETNGDFHVEQPNSSQSNDETTKSIEAVLRKLQQHRGYNNVAVLLHSPLRPHAGLGSKTALLLSVAKAYTTLHGDNLTARELAVLVGRGGTSGIGVEAFSSGGLIVDCGHSFKEKGETFKASSRSRDTPPAPLVGRYAMPNWPILIITPVARQIYGDLEQSLFEQVCPVPLGDVRAVSHAILMMMIPGAIENNIDLFSLGVSVIQKCRWKAFEIESQSRIVGAVMELLTEQGLTGVGMSSWGSTVFAVDKQLFDPNRQSEILVMVQTLLDEHNGGEVFITTARNEGHSLIAV